VKPRDDGHYKRLQGALEELLILKGIMTRADIDEEVSAMSARGLHRGAAVVARAWVDADYRRRLLADACPALQELGFDTGPLRLVVVENTAVVHNVIVCTLCSCYPRMLLGIPPLWYKSLEYRSRVVREPRAVLREFGLELPASMAIRVHDSTADMRYMVLPMRPHGTEQWTEEALAALVTVESLVGTGFPRPVPLTQALAPLG